MLFIGSIYIYIFIYIIFFWPRFSSQKQVGQRNEEKPLSEPTVHL